jgi:glutamyl/glutaminyl-tRNA synthetase
VLEQPRVHTLSEFGSACAFFFADLPEMDPKAVDKWFVQPHVGELFDGLIAKCGTDFTTETPLDVYENALRSFQESHGMEKLGPVVHPTRVALTGKTTGPGLFELMSVLGPDRMRHRLQAAKALLR